MSESTPDSPRVKYPPVLITGMSGAGLSTAAKVFEDKGFYVAHNVPPEILVDLVTLATGEDSPVDKVAVVADVRSRMFKGSLLESIATLREKGLMPTILFMDASDEVLISRFDSVRRTHPLQGQDTHSDGIARERESIEDLKAMADVVIDTSHLSVHDLRRAIEASFGDMSTDKQHITVQSFGFKHGAPLDADLMIDVRFLPNPYWVPELRGFRGTDEPVSDYVLSRPDAMPFIDKFMDLLESTLAGYRHEGKNYISVAVGCTGGHHRSVAVSEEIGRRLRESDELEVNVIHRDLKRD